MPKNKFINYLQYEKRFSRHTITSYKTDLKQFENFIENTFEETQLENVTSDYVRSWVVSLMEKGYNATTVNRKISTLKSLYKFLLTEQLIKVNPTGVVTSPKKAKKLPIFVEQDKMQILLNDVVFEDSFTGLRDKLILELFYSTGIRLSELINLTERNVNLYKGTIKVLGKRNKERIIPITKELKKILETYIIERKKIEVANDFMFLTEKKKKIYEKLVYRIVNNYLSAVSTMKKKSPHVLRHTFATHMLNNGADLNAIKELLGHQSLSATEVYTHNSFEKLKIIYKQAHPRA